MKNIKQITSIIILITSIINIVYADEFENKLITTDNPLIDKATITYTFTNNDKTNVLMEEKIAYNQEIYILDKDGNKIKEYAGRQDITLSLPNTKLNDGWVFKTWKKYYKEDILCLQPLYKITIVVNNNGKTLVNEVVDAPFKIIKNDKFKNELKELDIIKPTTIELTDEKDTNRLSFDKYNVIFDKEKVEINYIYKYIVQFTDNQKEIFKAKLNDESKIKILAEDLKNVNDTKNVEDISTVKLIPKDVEGKQFQHWDTEIKENNLYLYPIYTKVSKTEKIDIPKNVHANCIYDIKEKTSSEISTHDSIYIFSNNIAIITWGIPLLLVIIAYSIYFFIKKKKQKSKNEIINDKNQESEIKNNVNE